jgi:hypothetical protein
VCIMVEDFYIFGKFNAITLRDGNRLIGSISVLHRLNFDFHTTCVKFKTQVGSCDDDQLEKF